MQHKRGWAAARRAPALLGPCHPFCAAPHPLAAVSIILKDTLDVMGSLIPDAVPWANFAKVGLGVVSGIVDVFDASSRGYLT